MATEQIETSEVRVAQPQKVRLPRVRTRRPPRAPRRPPTAPPQRAPLTAGQLIVRSVFSVLAALLLAFVLNVTVLSQIQHLVAQQQLSDTYREQLAAGTAPVSEGNFNDVLLPAGAPLGIISIPSLGVNGVFVEGTCSDYLKSGPRHRRDTVLPGQAGISTIMARAAAYGGPFARLQELAPGDRFSVRTGQGKLLFTVIGVRYAGDPTLTSPTSTQSRLTFVTARGPAFIPSGIAYVDAVLVQPAEPAGGRSPTSGSRRRTSRWPRTHPLSGLSCSRCSSSSLLRSRACGRTGVSQPRRPGLFSYQLPSLWSFSPLIKWLSCCPTCYRASSPTCTSVIATYPKR